MRAKAVWAVMLRALIAMSIALSGSCARLLIPPDDVPLRLPDGYFHLKLPAAGLSS